MAKENKKGGLGIADVTTANLDEKLKSTNVMDQEVLDMATEKMEKEEKERRADELMRKIKKANYQNMHCHIDFKYQEDCAEVLKEMLKSQKAELDKMTKGEITAVEYEDALAKISKDGTKKINENADKRRTRLRELQKAYGEWYGMSWDDPFVRANAAIREGAR
jgi:DNA repair exonuclease SbcCD ATPase subunit